MSNEKTVDILNTVLEKLDKIIEKTEEGQQKLELVYSAGMLTALGKILADDTDKKEEIHVI